VPLFYLALNTGDRITQVLEPTEFPDEAAARAEATIIAREIMRNNRNRMRAWRLQVSDAEHNFCFELLFADAEEELQYLPMPIREAVTRNAEAMASLNDNIRSVRDHLFQLRATLARTDRMPYLAALNGTRIAS